LWSKCWQSKEGKRAGRTDVKTQMGTMKQIEDEEENEDEDEMGFLESGWLVISLSWEWENRWRITRIY
jgi:hypothetical protein